MRFQARRPAVVRHQSFRSRIASGIANFGAPQALVRAITQGLKVALIGLTALLIVVGGARYFAHLQHTAADAEGIGQSVKITIAKNDDTATVAHTLHQVGLIHSELYFKSLMKVKGGLLVPGTYVLPKGLSVTTLIALITR